MSYSVSTSTVLALDPSHLIWRPSISLSLLLLISLCSKTRSSYFFWDSDNLQHISIKHSIIIMHATTQIADYEVGTHIWKAATYLLYTKKVLQVKLRRQWKYHFLQLLKYTSIRLLVSTYSFATAAVSVWEVFHLFWRFSISVSLVFLNSSCSTLSLSYFFLDSDSLHAKN